MQDEVPLHAPCIPPLLPFLDVFFFWPPGFVFVRFYCCRVGAKDGEERERKLESWQAALDQRELAAEDLRERSRELEEAEKQV